MMTKGLPALAGALGAAAALCVATATTGTAQSALPVFTDATKAAGITFKHESGAFGKKYLPETMGAGGAFLDVDGDGWQDVLLVNGMAWPGRPAKRSVTSVKVPF